MNPPFPCKAQSAESDLHMVTTTYLPWIFHTLNEEFHEEAEESYSGLLWYAQVVGTKGKPRDDGEYHNHTCVCVCVYVTTFTEKEEAD